MVTVKTPSIKWRLETRKISSLKSHSKNPRKLSQNDGEHLQKSIEKFGLIDKPIITSEGVIIGGHQRIHILKKMGLKEVECYIPDSPLDQKDIDELNIRLNRNTGEWDYEILANEWNPADLVEWGFTLDDLELDSEVISDEEEEGGETLSPGSDEDAITKLGDVYDLGRHRLICGDSTDPECVAKLLGQNLPILMVTDPPYGVEYDPDWRNVSVKGQRASGKVKNDDRVNWALAWHLFPGSTAYMWHAGKFCSEVQKSLEESGFEIICQIIWVKQHFALSRGDYHWQHEPCWYAVKKGHKHNWQESRDQSTVWEISNLCAFGKSSEDERTAHSTQKPLECMKRPIINNTAEGEAVYDPFLGSGTTLMAAECAKRICFGIELSPAYCDIIVKRWIAHRRKNESNFIVKKNGEICEDFK